MKVIRLTTSLNFGGQEKQYLSMTEIPKLLRDDYVFAALGHGGHAEKVLIERGFKVVIFNRNPRVLNLLNIWRVSKWLKSENPDIVHTAAAEANFHGVIAAKLAGVKIIFAEEIGFPNHSNLARFIFRNIYKRINSVICVSNSVKNKLISLGEIKESQGVVLYNPVSLPKKFQRKQLEYFHIVYVGRLERVKNVRFLVEAIARIKTEQKVMVTIVGDGTERKILDKLIDDMELSEKIKIVGFLERPEKVVSQANLFVLPSLSEGFGIAVVEAMLQSVPCLCSNVGGISEIIDNGKNGWLFNPNNKSDFDEKLKQIMSLSNDQLDEVGNRAKEGALRRFSIQTYIEKLQLIYNQDFK